MDGGGSYRSVFIRYCIESGWSLTLSSLNVSPVSSMDASSGPQALTSQQTVEDVGKHTNKYPKSECVIVQKYVKSTFTKNNLQLKQ